VRVVTQAGNIGRPSDGAMGEPTAGFYFVDIPVEATVR
jgi:hypothetical protein